MQCCTTICVNINDMKPIQQRSKLQLSQSSRVLQSRHQTLREYVLVLEMH